MKRLIASAVLTLFVAVPFAQAKAPAPFTPAALATAQAAGEPVIVHVTATWCTTCAAQIPVVQSLLKQPKYANLVLLNLDFDRDKADVRKLGVQAQSTFVAFKGRNEVARSTGETDTASIARLFDKTE